ncbi:MAG: FAD-dependent oxidoreductase [Chloroflexi bacterium]|nr:FAD-dependent oxidoreductase [Chloroflexota bacterium]
MAKLKAREQLAAWRERFPAPCQAACPVHTDVRSYVTLTAKGQFEEAYRAVCGPNAVANICGRACSAPCEDVCTRGEFDKPVRIRQLKRFLGDRYQARFTPARPTGLSVGIVGAGPAGLAAARDLAAVGHAVTIYEAAPEPGGTALLGVPRFRLSKDAVERDIDAVRALGVEIRCGVRIGSDITLEELRIRHHALLVAAGAMRANVPRDLPKIDLKGVVQALWFLQEANLGGRPWCGQKVAVIGGGYTAMDAARTAVRLGAASVTVLYRRTRAESEVHDEEMDETLREGVQVQYLVSPLRVIDDGEGKAAGVQFIRNRLGEPDSSGRKRPVPIEGSEFVFEADTVILALGQAPDPTGIDVRPGAAPGRADDANLVTEFPGVFVAGDFVTGPSTIIEAAAEGRRAAAAIHRYLRETDVLGEVWPDIDALRIDILPAATTAAEPQVGERAALRLDLEVEQTLAGAAAMAEGLRCLHCGLPPTVVFDLCTACHACEVVCPVECIERVTVDADGTVRRTDRFDEVAVDWIDSERCIRCGRCFGACPTGAIVVDGFSWA